MVKNIFYYKQQNEIQSCLLATDLSWYLRNSVNDTHPHELTLVSSTETSKECVHRPKGKKPNPKELSSISEKQF
jgi:hypothetical protein